MVDTVARKVKREINMQGKKERFLGRGKESKQEKV